MSGVPSNIHIGVDVGGTFTDLALNLGDGSELVLLKLASTPEGPEQAILTGVRQILADHGHNASQVSRLAHGTTVGTNALIHRNYGKVALITSVGFRDLLEIGRQTRPFVYDIHSDHPAPLVDRQHRLEVPQRRLANGDVHIPLDDGAVVAAGKVLKDADVDSVVVCFLHSYAFPEDENHAADILRSVLPDRVTVLTSSSVYPEFREYERFSTAILNAALINIVGSYLDRLTAGVSDIGIASEVKISQSSGGLMSVSMARRLPVRASLSGPAAGVQGAAVRAQAAGIPNFITLDVGGTSSDVSLLRDGNAVVVHERDLVGFPLRLPTLDVNAVGAGGGSIAFIDRDRLLKVGPQSAGADPGPACYGLGGTDATVTDANVFLGRLNGEALLDGAMPIQRDLSENSIRKLSEDLGISLEETALGIVRVACATMSKAIRSISVERGHDPRDFALMVYGGAGPLHAIDVAEELGVGTVIVPPNPGILCAEGAINASLTSEFVNTPLLALEQSQIPTLRAVAGKLRDDCDAWFAEESVTSAERQIDWAVGLRYFGQNYELSLPLPDERDDAVLTDMLCLEFHKEHEYNYGFAASGEPIQIVQVSAKAIGNLSLPPLPRIAAGTAGKPVGSRRMLMSDGTWRDTPIYRRNSLVAGQQLNAPMIVEQMDTTVVAFEGQSARVDEWGNIIISLAG